MNQRPYKSTDLPSVIETYTASIRSLASFYYSPEQIAAWAPIPPDAARWQERLARLLTSSLYHRVEAALRAVGTPRVTTHASLVARAFFNRQGFQLDSEECVECRGAHLRRFFMRKQLADDAMRSVTGS